MISPEFSLLCRLLPVHFRGGMEWPDSFGGVDPESFRRFVAATQVAPHAFHVWEGLPALWESTPGETRARIVAWQEMFRHRQARRFEAWKELLSAFANEGLPVLPLKGFVLSESLYGDPFRRLSCDVDLLVRREDLPPLEAWLRSQGFRRGVWLGTRVAAESNWGRTAPGDTQTEVLDLHWDFTPSWHFLRAPLAAIWDETVETDTGGVGHRTLDPAGTALFSLINNTTDYGLGNLRGCVEALELLARLEGAAAGRFAQWGRAAHVQRPLAVLELFRSRFFPASRSDLVTRFDPAPRLWMASRFARWDYYLNQGQPSLWQQAGVRFTLAGPTPRFLRFCAGKVVETLAKRRSAVAEDHGFTNRRKMPHSGASL